MWSFRWFPRGLPDGQGMGEDPGSLTSLYGEFEDRCFLGTDPRDVELTKAWRPISKFLDELDFENRAKRESAQTLFEAVRFGEAALDLLFAISTNQLDAVPKYLAQFPEHLQNRLFGCEIRTEKITPYQRIFRQGFRLAWQQLNTDEVVPGLPDFLSDEAIDMVRESVHEQNTDFDLADWAGQTDYYVRREMRSASSNPKRRAETLMSCSQSMYQSRQYLTALLKLGKDL